MKHLHYWTTVGLLGTTTALLFSRGRVDKVPPSRPLESMPFALGPWTGTDVPLEGYVLDVLGKGIFLNRNYLPTLANASRTDASLASEDAAASYPASRNETPDHAPVGLFIGYFPTQRAGQAIHSPQNCLPGAGWVFSQSATLVLTAQDGKPYRVGSYLISNGKQQDVVLYWYQEHGRSIASDYVAKWYTLLDSIRYHRTDAALVRVITPIMPGESANQSQKRLVHFGNLLVSQLPAYIPD